MNPSAVVIPAAEPETVVDEALPRASKLTQFATGMAVVIPFAGLVAALVSVWGWGFGWTDLGLLVGMYVLTAFGITVGFHRLFTHRSFETYGVVKFVFAVLGSMAIQGPVLKWVAMHRRHHQHSDEPEDPHSPHHSGTGFFGVVKGFFHSHVGWAFMADPPGLDKYVPDLTRSAAIRLADKLFPLWVVLGLALPAALGGLITGTWTGALLGFLWGGAARVFLVHHVTWCVNSVCHLWGRRPYPEGDQSRNNLVFGILAMGEGWHNNHHAFPTSARHGLRWWQVDVSYYLIKMMELVGLAWSVKTPKTA